MPLPSSSNLASYTVVTQVYEGPLDLLLRLIEKAELEITKVSLAIVTNQFLEYLKYIPDTSADMVSSFLVIAAKLIQIKSEALLPRPPIRAFGEIDPGEALALQLITYKRFKEIAQILEAYMSRGMRTYPRIAPTPKVDTSLDFENIDLAEIYRLALDVFSRNVATVDIENLTAPPKTTIREKIQLIREYIQRNTHGNFNQLILSARHRIEVVITFLALLELVKRRMIEVHQDRIFGQIEFAPSDSWEHEDLSFDLEFGE
jgi:segregation and condensation protein A